VTFDMSIPTLPLAFIGWSFAIMSLAALTLGIVLLLLLHRSGKIPPEYLQTRLANEIALLIVWAIGLVSSIALLYGVSWGRTWLEYFCWVLIVLTVLSCASRLTATYRNVQGLAGKAWVMAFSAVLLIALPIAAICGVTIYTLRSDEVVAQFR
jgi:hypothetical protein